MTDSPTAAGPAPIDVTYTVTSEALTSVYWAYLWEQQGGYLMVAAFAAVVSIWQLMQSRDVGFWAFLLGVFALYWAGWFYNTHRLTRIAALYAQRPIHLSIDSVGLTAWTETASSWLSWAEITRLQRLKAGFVLIRGAGSPMMIPAEVLTADQAATLIGLARQAGVKIARSVK